MQKKDLKILDTEREDKMKKTKQIRIKKDYYMPKYYSVHLCEYKNGNIVYERLLSYFKKKKDAEKYKKEYIKKRR